jgi:hypothetical protein
MCPFPRFMEEPVLQVRPIFPGPLLWLMNISPPGKPNPVIPPRLFTPTRFLALVKTPFSCILKKSG